MKLHKVLITGSRNWTDKHAILEVISESASFAFAIKATLLVIHGDCPTGADAIAEAICVESGAYSARIAARWSAGKVAGPLRNRIMVALKPDSAHAFMMPESRGTVDCVEALRLAGIEPTIHSDFRNLDADRAKGREV